MINKKEQEALFGEPMRSNEPFEGIHRPIKRQPRFLNWKGRKEGIEKGWTRTCATGMQNQVIPTNDVDLKYKRGTSLGPTVE